MNGNMLSKQAWPLLPSGQIAIVVVLLREVRIRRELIALVDHRPASRPVPHRIIGKGLRVKQQGMAGADSATQYTEHLTASNRAIGRSLLITLRDDKTDLPVSEISLDIPGKASIEISS